MTTTSPRTARTSLPLRFHLWWTTSTLETAGSSMLGFALIWLATGHGAGAVALVSTLSILPPVLLLLLGGVLGDRLGPRRLLLTTSLLQLAALLVLLLFGDDDPSIAYLAGAAAVTSTISAFRQPAAIVYPRTLITDDEQLPRALARISGSVHAARILGVSAGGIAISAWSLELILTVGAVLTLGGIGVLRALRSPAPAVPSVGGRPESVWRALSTGIRSTNELRIWPLLAAVALVCAAVLPVVAVVLPSAARVQGWSGSQAGLLEASWAAGTLGVTLLVSFTGTLARQERALIGGPLLMAVALSALALPLGVPATLLAAALLGVGTAIFTTHIAPLLLRRAPAGQMARFQSLMAIVQLVPPALLNGPAAALAGNGSASLALLLAAAFAGGAAVSIALAGRSIAVPPVP